MAVAASRAGDKPESQVEQRDQGQQGQPAAGIEVVCAPDRRQGVENQGRHRGQQYQDPHEQPPPRGQNAGQQAEPDKDQAKRQQNGGPVGDITRPADPATKGEYGAQAVTGKSHVGMYSVECVSDRMAGASLTQTDRGRKPRHGRDLHFDSRQRQGGLPVLSGNSGNGGGTTGRSIHRLLLAGAADGRNSTGDVISGTGGYQQAGVDNLKTDPLR